jgi:hypothetical protein
MHKYFIILDNSLVGMFVYMLVMSKDANFIDHFHMGYLLGHSLAHITAL